MRCRHHPDGIPQLDLLHIHIQKMQVNGVQSNGGQEPGGFFQIPVPGT